jgi:hypothetical protein
MSTHAKLAPSAAHRWMHCPGSVALCAGQPDESSEYADEGTFAHSLAARCLTTEREAKSVLGTVSVDGRFRCGDEMARAIQVYLDVVRQQELVDGASASFVEQRVHVSKDVHGTADKMTLSADGRTLHVFDFKYGAGVFVDAERNEQMMLYGLGALLTHATLCKKVETVELHVVQPRYFGDSPPWRSWSVSATELRTKFGAEVVAAVKATQQPRPTLASGSHCKFCKAKAVCPQLRKDALASAQHAFAVPAKVAPEPKTLDAAEVARLLPLFTRAEEWISAVRAHAYELANRGEPISGYKLVQKVGNRKWIDEEAVVVTKLGEAGIDPWKPREPISPAEAERRLGKKRAGIVDPLTVRPATGTVLVEESDKRPAISAGAVFDKVESPNNGVEA